MAQDNLYLLIHTMTITETDYIVQAQFFHTFSEDLSNAVLVAKRMRLRIHPCLRGGNRLKAHFQRLNAPSLKTLMKRNPNSIKHHLRTLKLNPQVQNPLPRTENIGSIEPAKEPLKVSEPYPEKKSISIPIGNASLTQRSTPEETVQWLSKNRFVKYAATFERFSGDDMLRMSRDDFIQICGDADGIRLHNALHLKTIPPKLKIYVCPENSSVYNAIFLSSHSYAELLQKLSRMIGVPKEHVYDVHLEGPRSIHIQLSDDVLKHIKEETMFSLEVTQENNGYHLLLKRSVQ